MTKMQRVGTCKIPISLPIGQCFFTGWTSKKIQDFFKNGTIVYDLQSPKRSGFTIKTRATCFTGDCYAHEFTTKVHVQNWSSMLYRWLLSPWIHSIVTCSALSKQDSTPGTWSNGTGPVQVYSTQQKLIPLCNWKIEKLLQRVRCPTERDWGERLAKFTCAWFNLARTSSKISVSKWTGWDCLWRCSVACSSSCTMAVGRIRINFWWWTLQDWNRIWTLRIKPPTTSSLYPGWVYLEVGQQCCGP